MTEQELIRKQEEGGNETLYLMKVGCSSMPTMRAHLHWHG